MDTKFAKSSALVAALSVVLSFSAAAQDAAHDVKAAGEGTKKAATATGHAVKKGTVTGYRKTKEGTEAAAHETKKGTVAAYDKTKEGTEVAARKTKNGTVKAAHKTKEVSGNTVRSVEGKPKTTTGTSSGAPLDPVK